MHKGDFKNYICIGFLAGLLFLLTPAIDNYRYDFFSKKGIFQKDMLYKMLGDARKILSRQSYVNADVYYHGGIYKKDYGACKHIEHISSHSTDSQEHADHREAFHKGSKPTGLSKLNILPRIGELIGITEHIHLYGEREKELLPWFYYAVRLDPNNVDAYVIGGYWIGSRLNKPEEAIKFLKEGATHNPGAWDIYNELGHIYLIVKKDYANALTNFKKAYALLTDDNSDKFDKRQICSFLAACYEKLGDIDNAVEFYREVLILFPDDPAVTKKINSLLSPDA